MLNQIKNLENLAYEMLRITNELKTRNDMNTAFENVNKIPNFVPYQSPTVTSIPTLEYIPVANPPECLYIGNDKDGNPVFLNINDNPHTIITGRIRCGKAKLLDVILTNLLIHNSTNDVIIYPMQICKDDFVLYKNYANVKRVCKTLTDVNEVLISITKEIDSRIELLSKYHEVGLLDNIFDYNKIAKEKSPFIYVVIDEIDSFTKYDFDTNEDRIIKKSILNNLTKVSQFGGKLGIQLIATVINANDNFNKTILSHLVSNKVSFSQLNNSVVELLVGGNTKTYCSVPHIEDSQVYKFLNKKE